jgi:hypothetical protein
VRDNCACAGFEIGNVMAFALQSGLGGGNVLLEARRF